MHPEWVRSLRDQCQVAKVPFFFKQWGEWAPDPISGIGMIRVGKKRAGRILDGREWSEVPNG
jgi:protein gp37